MRGMNPTIAAHALVCLLSWAHPRSNDAPRLRELADIAAQIGATDASEEESETLVAVAIHESNAHLRAVGDGGLSRGAWQVRGRDISARAALAKMRWSMRACGDLSLYAGFGRCGGDPVVLTSLIDPTVPRR